MSKLNNKGKKKIIAGYNKQNMVGAMSDSDIPCNMERIINLFFNFLKIQITNMNHIINYFLP